MVRQNVSFVGSILFYTVILSGMALPPLAYLQYVRLTTWYNDVMDNPDRDDGDDLVNPARLTGRAFRKGINAHEGWYYYDGQWYRPDNYDCSGCKLCNG